jgi:hypothetical protein
MLVKTDLVSFDGEFVVVLRNWVFTLINTQFVFMHLEESLSDLARLFIEEAPMCGINFISTAGARKGHGHLCDDSLTGCVKVQTNYAAILKWTNKIIAM